MDIDDLAHRMWSLAQDDYSADPTSDIAILLREAIAEAEGQGGVMDKDQAQQAYAASIGTTTVTDNQKQDAFTSSLLREVTVRAALGWIPVAERLPDYEKDRQYLVLYASFLDGASTLAVAGTNQDGEWIDDDGLNMAWHNGVSHWMPRPPDP